jgi:DNA helicase II / ATP-dependent DNA helicase PcrA
MTRTAAGSVWATGLDPVQLQAVEHDGGPLLIVAGAGTGKTRTLVARLARLIDSGVAPDRLLLVTFSRRAADEMVRRLAPLVGAAVARQVPAGTFHSVAVRLLRAHAVPLGLGDGFSVIDQGDCADLMHWASQQEGGSAGDRRRFPRKDTLVSIYSRVVNSQLPLRKVLRGHFPWVQEHEPAITRVFQAYSERKRAGGMLDFDDLLLFWRAAMADPAAGPALAASWDHALVDEYQDTNVLQAEIIRSLHHNGCEVTAVGDDAQAIYAFRAATVRNMLGFHEDFPGADTITLERNYRSTQPILDLANAVLAESSEGYPKRLWTDATGGPKPLLATCPDEGAQAGAVAEVILEHHEAGTPLRQQVVLFRSAHHSDLLEVELHRRGIPYVKYGGLRFLEAAHIRDLMAALRVMDNPLDELAWFRLLLLLEGVGPSRARRIMEEIGVSGSGPPSRSGLADWQAPDPPAQPVPTKTEPVPTKTEPVPTKTQPVPTKTERVRVKTGGPVGRFAGGPASLPARAATDAAGLATALIDCTVDDLAPGARIDRLREALAPLFRRRYDNAEVRLLDLDALARLSTGFDTAAGMVAELTLDPPSSTGDLAGPPVLDDDYVTLSTVHSAKGGEWRVVHLIHAADGMFPSDMATGRQEDIEEERRLFYVALTRAKELLHIYAPLRYHRGGPFGRGDTHSYAQRTRFLPPSANDLLDHRAVRTRSHDTAVPSASTALPSAVDTALRALW